MKYPRKLSSGANNTVIVLSDDEVAKLLRMIPARISVRKLKK